MATTLAQHALTLVLVDVHVGEGAAILVNVTAVVVVCHGVQEVSFPIEPELARGWRHR